MVPYLLTMVLLAIGVYAIACKRNLIKVIIGVMIAEYAVNLFLILTGYRFGKAAPIRTAALDKAAEAAGVGGAEFFVSHSVDPLPQALILTSIVIGLGTVALMASMAIRLYEKYGTFDVSEMKKLRG
jgi:multicomponent Na+:H+ antiporter subunit C